MCCQSCVMPRARSRCLVPSVVPGVLHLEETDAAYAGDGVEPGAEPVPGHRVGVGGALQLGVVLVAAAPAAAQQLHEHVGPVFGDPLPGLVLAAPGGDL